MLKRPTNRLRLLLSVSTSLVPAVAWSQVEKVLLQSSNLIPVANTWYVDEAGNFVLMSEAQRQAVELAQLTTPQVPLQSLTETASSSMQIRPEMLQQVMAYSAAMGGVAGGGLVGSLALSSGMLRGDDGVDGTDGDSAYQVWLDLGNSGTVQDFIDSLTGPAGIPGEDYTYDRMPAENHFGAARTETVNLTEGPDILAFGDFVGAFGGHLNVNCFGGDDVIEFGTFLGASGGSIMIDLGDGDDILQVGESPAFRMIVGQLTELSINCGEGADTVKFDRVGSSGPPTQL